MLKGIALTPLAGVDGSAQLRRRLRRDEHRARRSRCRIPTTSTCAITTRRSRGSSARSWPTSASAAGAARRPVWAELVTGNYFQVLGVRAAARPHAAAVRRGRARPPSGRRHQRRPVAARLRRRSRHRRQDRRDQQRAADGRRASTDAAFHGTIVSYDVEVFIPVMMAPQLGFTFGSQETTPSGILADRTRRGLLSAGLPAAGHDPGRAPPPRATRSGPRSRAIARRPTPAERLRVVPFWQSPGSGQTYMLPTLIVLSAMGLLVLLIACANIAGLVLVRGVSRRGEIAVRLALGATRTRIVRLLIVENLVLALPGAVLGILLAWHGIPVLWSPTPSGSPRRSVSSSTSTSTASSSASRCWSPAAARSSSGSSRRCRARESIWSRSSTTTRRRAARRADACAPASWSRRSRSRSCCWSAPDW